MFYNRIAMEQELFSELTFLKIHYAANILTEAGKGARRVNRPRLAIIFKYEGETVYTCGGKTLVSNRENAVILPQGSSYEWKCVRAGRFFVLEADCACAATTPAAFPVFQPDNLLRLFQSCEYKCTLKNPAYKAEVFAGAYEILSILLRPAANKSYLSGTRREKIAPALDFIAENYRLKIKNARLAALCGMSEVYFRKTFTAVTGCSPIAFLHAVRTRKAAEILKSDFVSLSEVAVSAGYADLSEFSRAFKKQTGLSPREYVRKQQSEAALPDEFS